MEKFAPQPKPEREQAEFNNAFAFLERLCSIEYAIENNLASWNVKEAYACLESYENELAFCFKEDEKEKIKGIKKEIIKIFNEVPLMGQIGFDAAHQKYIIGREEMGLVRSKIIELNQYLRQIKFKNGMTMPKRGEGKLF